MRLSICHKTTYLYPEAVAPSPHLIAMRPADRPDRILLSHSIQVTPSSHQTYSRDVFGNYILNAYFDSETDKISIVAEMEIETPPFNPFDFIIDTEADAYPFSYNATEKRSLSGFLTIGSPTACANVLPWIRKQIGKIPNRSIELVSELNRKIHQEIRYLRRESPGIQTPDETIALGSGSCRDLAVLMIEGCRQLGIAARFVSGYLYQPNTQTSAIKETLSLHAWAEIYLPGAGWIQVDPTNGIYADAAFIPCAMASDPHLANPVRGTYSHCKAFVPSELQTELTAEPLS